VRLRPHARCCVNRMHLVRVRGAIDVFSYTLSLGLGGFVCGWRGACRGRGLPRGKGAMRGSDTSSPAPLPPARPCCCYPIYPFYLLRMHAPAAHPFLVLPTLPATTIQYYTGTLVRHVCMYSVLMHLSLATTSRRRPLPATACLLLPCCSSWWW
jgi:hypothetical protein